MSAYFGRTSWQLVPTTFGILMTEGQELCQRHSKLFSGGKNAERPQPGRRRGKSDRRQKLHDFLDGHARRKSVQNGLIIRPGRQEALQVHLVSEQGAGHRGFAAATRTDDEPDMPRLLLERQPHVPLLSRLLGRRNIEETLHLRYPGSANNGAIHDHMRAKHFVTMMEERCCLAFVYVSRPHYDAGSYEQS